MQNTYNFIRNSETIETWREYEHTALMDISHKKEWHVANTYLKTFNLANDQRNSKQHNYQIKFYTI